MNYQHPQLIDELAAHYVLGTLRGPARRRFERLTLRDAVVLAAVHRWEERLLDLGAEVTAVQPSPLVWRRVQRAIRRERSRMGNHIRLAMAAGVATVAVAIGFLTWNQSTEQQVIATVLDQQRTLWRIEARSDRASLHVTALAAVARDELHAYELWALPMSGAAPVSLGLMPQSGQRELKLSESQQLALARSQKVAISFEPRGGSPTGAPTGPVLFVAEVSSSQS